MYDGWALVTTSLFIVFAAMTTYEEYERFNYEARIQFDENMKLDIAMHNTHVPMRCFLMSQLADGTWWVYYNKEEDTWIPVPLDVPFDVKELFGTKFTCYLHRDGDGPALLINPNKYQQGQIEFNVSEEMTDHHLKTAEVSRDVRIKLCVFFYVVTSSVFTLYLFGRCCGGTIYQHKKRKDSATDTAPVPTLQPPPTDASVNVSGYPVNRRLNVDAQTSQI